MDKSIGSKFLFSLSASLCLVFISGPAFAQRAGGGGFHGGGGFRGGGGAGFRGGGFNGSNRGVVAPRGGGAFVRPGIPGGFRPQAPPESRSMRPGLWNGTRRAMVPGRPSRFPNSADRWSPVVRRGNGPGSAPPSGIRSGTNGEAWQPFGANRALGVRNSISRAGSLSAIHRAFGNSGFSNLRPGLNASVPASSRFGASLPVRPGGAASGPGSALRNSFNSGLAFNRFGFRDFDGFRNFNRFRFHPPFGSFPFRDFDDFFFFRQPFFFNEFFFRRPFFGCFGCGFGFAGFNFGFGAPLLWGPGWPAWYSGFADSYGLPYGYSLPYDHGLTYNSASTGTSTPTNAENSSAILLLYLKDGTMYWVRECWLANGELHCTATDRSERIIGLDEIDFQRTVDENARRGVPFTLKPNR
jgi:hypothetical protein